MRALLAALLLAGCSPATTADAIGPAGPAGKPASAFPKPDRTVARIVSDQFSDEDTRDRAGEAEKVMNLLGIRPGMTVADIGAGNGYYTVRLSKRVGTEGRIFAEDIVPEYLQRLKGRVEAEGLANVTLALGDQHDPRLPVGELDMALLVHMYHEVEQPYGLLWNLHAALKPGAHVAIVDADRPTNRHGTPPKLLACEMAQVGYRQIAFHTIAGADSYLAVFESSDPRPNTANIKPCRG